MATVQEKNNAFSGSHHHTPPNYSAKLKTSEPDFQLTTNNRIQIPEKFSTFAHKRNLDIEWQQDTWQLSMLY